MKLPEWLKTILVQIVEKPEDADLFLAASNLKDVEFTDDMAKAFNKKFLTRESAANDTELVKQFQKEARGYVFGSVDQKIKKLLPFLSAEDKVKVDTETDTLKKLELIESILPNLGKGSGDEDKVKQISEAARKKEKELHDQNENLTKEINNLKSGFESKLKDTKLDYILRTKVMGFELAPEFSSEEHKNFLADSRITKLRQNFVLEFDETNPSTIHLRKNIDGAVKDVYEGNKLVTLEDVLKKEYEPFIKKSNGEEGHNQKQKTIETPLTDQPVLKPGATLREMINASA